MFNIAIFISGLGTNAKNIIEYFSDHRSIHVKLIISNNSKSSLLNEETPYKQLSNTEFLKDEILLKLLKEYKITHIILAGFLLKIPSSLIENLPKKILNIHPSLLPEFGGKGMYGINVHKAVYSAKKTETGITIHQVSSEYDEGKIIFQAKCSISKGDSPKDIMKKVQQLEYKFYPVIIEKYILYKNDN